MLVGKDAVAWSDACRCPDGRTDYNSSGLFGRRLGVSRFGCSTDVAPLSGLGRSASCRRGRNGRDFCYDYSCGAGGPQDAPDCDAFEYADGWIHGFRHPFGPVFPDAQTCGFS